MSKPWVLVCLLLLIVFSSQFEWKQQFENENEATPNSSQKQEHISRREESVKEKIILSQEKNIQRLNEVVRSLRQQLLECRGEINVANRTSKPFGEIQTELEQLPVVED